MYYETGIIDVDSFSNLRVTWNRYNDYFPMWSPDGTKIAFLSSPERGSGIYHSLGRVATVDSGGSRVITVIDAKDLGTRYEHGIHGVDMAPFPPVWSPDGKRVAFFVHERSPPKPENALGGTGGKWLGGLHGYGVYTVGVDGSDLRRIAAGYGGAAWSPDGGRLALVTLHGDAYGLITVAADGGDPRVIMRVSGIEGPQRKISLTPVAWSPDGRHILLRCDGRVCVVNLNGELVGLSPPLDPDGWGLDASWSPDGSRIAVLGAFDATRVSRDLSDPIVLFTMAPDGSDVRYLLGRRKDRELKPLGAVRSREFQGSAVCGAVPDCAILWRVRDTLAGSATLDWWPVWPMARWEGVELVGLHVEALSLSESRLWGRIPAELSELPELRRVLLNGNILYGSIPAELGQIANLTHLDLSDNELTGAIPPELGQLAKLERLDVRDNRLTGTIPAELVQLVNLDALYLRGNALTGCIPPALHEVPDNDLDSLGLPDCKPG